MANWMAFKCLSMRETNIRERVCVCDHTHARERGKESERLEIV